MQISLLGSRGALVHPDFRSTTAANKSPLIMALIAIPLWISYDGIADLLPRPFRSFCWWSTDRIGYKYCRQADADKKNVTRTTRWNMQMCSTSQNKKRKKSYILHLQSTAKVYIWFNFWWNLFLVHGLWTKSVVRAITELFTSQVRYFLLLKNE